MAEPCADVRPLPLNFPQDFLPERRLLARLLPFAAANGGGDKIEIGVETGIPTGKSSGKVEPMIHYARGMGLIRAGKDTTRWQLEPTTLGRLIAAEDPYLSEPVTLWLLHLLLCRRSTLEEPITGLADAWFALFAEGALRIGDNFDQATFLAYLTERHGTKSYIKGLSGLVLRSYLEPTCFGPINALSTQASGGQILYSRHAAPLEPSHFPAYSTYLFMVWDALYAGQSQLAMDDIFAQSRCLAVMGWNRATANRWLDWMADHGLLQLDRQTGGTMALRLRDTKTVIDGTFDGLI